MPCTNVIDFVTRETGRFDQEIYSRMFARSPWVGLTRKDAFPEGMGETISNLTYERNVPVTAVPTWADMTVADGSPGGQCLPSATKINAGSTVRSYNLARRVLEGPDFCAEDLRTPFSVAKQLDSILNIITEYAMVEWEIRYRHEFLRLTKRKWIVGSSSVFEILNGTAFATFCPGGVLTQGVLNKAKQKLLRDGAINSALGMENANAILTLITDAETSDRLIFDNADIRQDLRYGKPSELLAPYGVERSYRGFYHLIDMYPIRYTCAAGVYTEVAAFKNATYTKGGAVGGEVNDSWEAAGVGTSHIFDPTVFLARIPRPVTAPGGGLKFDALNYTVGAGGNWTLKNIPDRDCNPDGTIVFHRGHLAEGSEPVHPERGISIAHLRCDPALNLITSCVG